MRIALVSEHANPLAALGGDDAGGQNVHVAALAGGLAQRGHEVTVYTRRDDHGVPPPRVTAPDGYVVEHVAGRAARADVPKDELLPYMPAFGDRPRRAGGQPTARRRARPLLDERAGRRARRPQHAASRSCRPSTPSARSSGGTRARPTPARRSGSTLERRLCRSVDHVVATCTRRGRRAAGAGPAGAAAPASSPAAWTPTHFRPRARGAPRSAGRGSWSSAGSSPRKGVGNVIEALRDLPGVELVVAGGPAPTRWTPTPRSRGCGTLAAHLGVADRVRFLGAVDRARRAGPDALGRRRRLRARGTSRSASCRSRRWPAAARWSGRPSAGCWTPSCRASPASWCRRGPGRAGPGAASAAGRPASGARTYGAAGRRSGPSRRTAGDRVVPRPRTSTGPSPDSARRRAWTSGVAR